MGKERAGREVKAVSPGVLLRADLDGDGADELLFRDGDRLCAVGRDLKDRWCWPTRDPVREVIPARAGQPAVVVLDSMVGLDGATGRPRWDGHGSTAVLDPGDSARRPRLLAESGDATVCRLARATTAKEQYEVSGGEPVVQHRSAIDDPRWMRPLPWNVDGAGWLRAIFLLGSLAFVNVVVPVVILRLATRRGVWGVRLLMALPVVVAIPLAVWVVVLFRSVPLGELIASSMPGLAVLEYASAVGQSIYSRR